MISQVFILTARGDPIVSKDYRGDTVRGAVEIFFRKLKSFPGDPPPIFNVEGIHFIHIRRSTLYFVCTTKFNVAPAVAQELLSRLASLCKDYCGVLTEESIRVNFVLVYELLDEALDFGYGQLTTTEGLKPFVFSDPVSLHQEDPVLAANKHAMPSSAPNKPIALRFSDQRDRKNEIFIDLLERLTCLFGPSGSVLRSEIDGCIQMKSFLQGTPDVSLGLNEDLIIGKHRGMYGLVLDDCNFHECVNTAEFDTSKTLTLRPPEGEFTLMNYRITGQFQHPLPLRLSFSLGDSPNPGRTDATVKLDIDLAPKSFASNIVVRIPLPKVTTACAYELLTPGQQAEFRKDEKVFLWRIPKLMGTVTSFLQLKIMTADADKRLVANELGNISVEFEAPMHVCSGLAIRFLRVTERGRSYVPFRWVRYITHSDSYVFRIR